MYLGRVTNAGSFTGYPLKPRQRTRRWLALLFIVSGAYHFISVETYLGMMPAYVPYPRAAIYLSGAAEVLGGIGVLLPRWQKAAAWGLIVLLAALLPANLHLAINGWEAVSLPSWILWASVPLQFLLMAWIYHACLSEPKSNSALTSSHA